MNYPPSAPTITITPTPVAPTFPYLPDNFYYTAASVAPPPKPQNGYAQLLHPPDDGDRRLDRRRLAQDDGILRGAQLGQWRHRHGRRRENFDWARTDVEPGLLNLNLIIDEEVFAGLFDDPRLNDRLATYPARLVRAEDIPQIVTQIDANGYADGTATRSPTGTSINQLNFDLRTRPGYTATLAAMISQVEYSEQREQ